MKKIPYAVGSFEQIQEQGYYYVDKTRYIAVLENFQVPVFLRPRRFGKSLWCATLECYYDIRRKEKFKSLFGNTWIGQNPTPLKNSFMVLRLINTRFPKDIQNYLNNFPPTMTCKNCLPGTTKIPWAISCPGLGQDQ